MAFVASTWQKFNRTIFTGIARSSEIFDSNISWKLGDTLNRDEQQKSMPTFKNSLLFAKKVAVRDSVNEYTYFQIYMTAKKLSVQISNLCGSGASSHIAFMCPNNVLSPIVIWACWISGQVVMPLNPYSPLKCLKYYVENSHPKVLIATSTHEIVARNTASDLGLPVIVLNHDFISTDEELLPALNKLLRSNNDVHMFTIDNLSDEFYTRSNALLIYAPSTEKPKGVLLTHRTIDFQIKCLVHAWQLNSADNVLHVLPLFCMYGCIHMILCPLYVGGTIFMLDPVDRHKTWSHILGISIAAKDRVNVFMANAEIYNSLIAEYDNIFSKNSRMVEYIKCFCEKNIRLMISGSGAIPINIYNRWLIISGHKLLEWYGTPEIGIALSNPYIEERRQPGTVGIPLPNVKVRLMSAENNVIFSYDNDGQEESKNLVPMENNSYIPQTMIGELQVAGPTVFKEYLNKKTDTEKVFFDGFFRSGTLASFENGAFKILEHGITNMEEREIYIQEMESALFKHPAIKDAFVLNISDNMTFEHIGVFCVLKPDTKLDIESLQEFCKEIFPTYKLPTLLKIVDTIPRNELSNKDCLFDYFFCKYKK